MWYRHDDRSSPSLSVLLDQRLVDQRLVDQRLASQALHLRLLRSSVHSNLLIAVIHFRYRWSLRAAPAAGE